MNYELISAEDYNNLPEESDLKFVEIDRICRRNMTAMIDQNTSGEFDAMVRLQYMTTLSAAAAELGITGINYPRSQDYPAAHFPEFMLAVSGAVTRIRLRAGARAAPYSVKLANRTKARIELEIQRLRTIINDADIPEGKRQALLDKLNELVAELNQTRLSFAKTLKILAAIAFGIGGGTAFLADVPQAIVTIASLIGADKEAEETEAKRLTAGADRPLLPAPTKPEGPPPNQPRQAATTRPRSAADDLDDDIPF